MSLIGPRPERVFHADRLADEIAHYQFRHSVKPGMTGWAQVNGLRGDTDFKERIRLDIYYIENWSLLLDIQILLMTIFQKIRLPGPPQPDPITSPPNASLDRRARQT